MLQSKLFGPQVPDHGCRRQCGVYDRRADMYVSGTLLYTGHGLQGE